MTAADGNRIALELEQARPYLMRFALLQLGNETAAEDAVQETLLRRAMLNYREPRE